MKSESLVLGGFILIAIVAVLFSLTYSGDEIVGEGFEVTKNKFVQEKQEVRKTISRNVQREEVKTESLEYDPKLDLFSTDDKNSFSHYREILTEDDFQELLKMNEVFQELSEDEMKILASGTGGAQPPASIDWNWFKGKYVHDKKERKPCKDKIGSWADYKKWVDTFYNGNLLSSGWNHYENKWLNTDLTGGDKKIRKQIEDLLDEKGKRISGDFAFKTPRKATVSWGQTQLNALEDIATGTVGPQSGLFGTSPGDYATMKDKQQAFKDKLDAINVELDNGGVPPNGDVSSQSATPGPC